MCSSDGAVWFGTKTTQLHGFGHMIYQAGLRCLSSLLGILRYVLRHNGLLSLCHTAMM